MKNKEKTKDSNHSYLRKKSNVGIHKNEEGITLIALVVTIIVLLILARSCNCDTNRREWDINKCN